MRAASSFRLVRRENSSLAERHCLARASEFHPKHEAPYEGVSCFSRSSKSTSWSNELMRKSGR